MQLHTLWKIAYSFALLYFFRFSGILKSNNSFMEILSDLEIWYSMQLLTLFSPLSMRPICFPELPIENPKSSCVRFFLILISLMCSPRALRKILSTIFCTCNIDTVDKKKKAHTWAIYFLYFYSQWKLQSAQNSAQRFASIAENII